MLEGNIPKILWADMEYTTDYLINKSPSKAPQGVIPYNRQTGRIPSVLSPSYFRLEILCTKKEEHGNSTKGTLGIFVRCTNNTKNFRLYISEKQKSLIISRYDKIINQPCFNGVRSTCQNTPAETTEYDSKEKLPDQTTPLACITSDEKISENQSKKDII